MTEDGWVGVRNFEDGFAILHPSPPDTAITAASGVTRGLGGAEIAPGAEGFLSYAESLDGLGVTNVTETTLGSRDAIKFDVDPTADLPGVFFLKEDRYNLAEGATSRFWVTDLNGVTVVLVVEPGPTATLDEGLPLALPIVESIEFGD